MAMVGVVSGSLYRRTLPTSSGLVLGRQPLGAILHSSNEPGELSQWLCHDDSTINIVMVIIIITYTLILDWIYAVVHLTFYFCIENLLSQKLRHHVKVIGL